MDSNQIDDTVDFTFIGVLEGHSNWITSIVSGFPQKEGEDSQVLISGSRDHTIMKWKLFSQAQDKQSIEKPANETLYGVPEKCLTGHNHFISDLSLSQDNQYLISASWDKNLRLWDLKTGKTQRRFIGHEKEILSVAFSPDNRQIISTGADKTLKLWNILGDCKFTSDQNNHTDWVSCVRYSPLLKSATKQQLQPYFTTVGWDGRVKVWNNNFQIRFSFKPHDSNINTVAISPNGKFLCTGGKDQVIQIWDATDCEEAVRKFDAGANVNQISFNPALQWVSAATDNGIKIWDLMGETTNPIGTLTVEQTNTSSAKNAKGLPKKQKNLQCTALCWNSTGKKLFGGFTDGKIRVWHVNNSQEQSQ